VGGEGWGEGSIPVSAHTAWTGYAKITVYKDLSLSLLTNKRKPSSHRALNKQELTSAP
jgi:hypothetical protein